MYIKVAVYAGAKKERVLCNAPHSFTIAVREKAERNLANGHIRELVAKHFRVPISAVRIATGHRQPHKILDVSLP